MTISFMRPGAPIAGGDWQTSSESGAWTAMEAIVDGDPSTVGSAASSSGVAAMRIEAPAEHKPTEVDVVLLQAVATDAGDDWEWRLVLKDEAGATIHTVGPYKVPAGSRKGHAQTFSPVSFDHASLELYGGGSASAEVRIHDLFIQPRSSAVTVNRYFEAGLGRRADGGSRKLGNGIYAPQIGTVGRRYDFSLPLVDDEEAEAVMDFLEAPFMGNAGAEFVVLPQPARAGFPLRGALPRPATSRAAAAGYQSIRGSLVTGGWAYGTHKPGTHAWP